MAEPWKENVGLPPDSKHSQRNPDENHNRDDLKPEGILRRHASKLAIELFDRTQKGGVVIDAEFIGEWTGIAHLLRSESGRRRLRCTVDSALALMLSARSHDFGCKSRLA
jgi:hypothetical protein